MTNDEDCNLAIAINARLLSPHIPVLARVRTPAVAANMASFETDHIVNAYERFAEYLGLAVSAPSRFRLIEILTGLPGTPVPPAHIPPKGHWIVCGYGHFGQAIARYLSLPGIDITIIDPDEEGPVNGRIVRGMGSEAGVLKQAGILDAAGIVAGADNDIDNLSIAMMAKQINPDIFIVLRQNQAANDLLFDTFRADFSMVHTRVVAQECISILTTPLLARFLGAMRQSEEAWSRTLAATLQTVCDGLVPEVWDVRIHKQSTPAVDHVLSANRTTRVGDLMRDNTDREQVLPAVVLMIERAEQLILLPDQDFALKAGDALLLAGQHPARSRLNLSLQNLNALEYVLTGADRRGGWLWRKLFAGRRAA